MVLEAYFKESSWLSLALKKKLIRNKVSLIDFGWLRIQLLCSLTTLLIFQSLSFLLLSISLYSFSKYWFRLSINSVIEITEIYLKLRFQVSCSIIFTQKRNEFIFSHFPSLFIISEHNWLQSSSSAKENSWSFLSWLPYCLNPVFKRNRSIN